MEKFSTDLDSQRFGNSCLEKFSTEWKNSQLIWILNDLEILVWKNSQRFGFSMILNDLEKSCLEILVW